MFYKQLITVLMLILIISHGTVQLFILKVFQAQHKTEIIQSIYNGTFKEDLILFKFNKDEFEKGIKYIEWADEDEFIIEKEMYDVVKSEVKRDSIYLYCLHDNEESILYSTIVEIFNKLVGDETANTGNLTSMNNLFNEFYFSKANELNKLFLEENSFYLPVKSFDLLDGETFIDTPPPRS
jgi:hypothetical protein